MQRPRIVFLHRFKKLRSAMLLLGIAPLLAGTDRYRATGNDNEVRIVAHRGGTKERPENALPAYKRAVELGADILEMDLRTSKDGKSFILHDATLDRTTSGNGPAGDLTMGELSGSADWHQTDDQRNDRRFG